MQQIDQALAEDRVILDKDHPRGGLGRILCDIGQCPSPSRRDDCTSARIRPHENSAPNDALHSRP